MDLVVIVRMHTLVGLEVVLAGTSNEGIWLDSKRLEQGVLTWEGEDVGVDSVADDG